MFKKYFLLILLSLFTLASHGMALKRNFEDVYYCQTHLKTYDRQSLISPYLSLIPADPSKKCYSIDCSICHKACPQEFGHYDIDTDTEWTELHWNCLCKDKLCNISSEYWDEWMPTWKRCANKPIYAGYLSNNYTKFFSCFFEYLRYSHRNRQCHCYWPEISKKAAHINDIAYDLFREVFEETQLYELYLDEDLQKKFYITIPDNGFSIHGLAITCVCHSFFYSDYDWICREIEFFSKSHFLVSEYVQIKNQLDNIRETLAPLFLDLYSDCVKAHKNEHIEQELILVCDFLNVPLVKSKSFDFFENSQTAFDQKVLFEADTASLSSFYEVENSKTFIEEDRLSLIAKGPSEIPARPNNWRRSEILLLNGVLLNELLLYQEAIKTLSTAIILNPTNCDAYIERATAYFETNQLTLALEDYKTAKKLKIVPPFEAGKLQAKFFDEIYVPDDNSQFSIGLLSGLKDGSKDSLIESIPSTLSCMRGILHCLWWASCKSHFEITLEVGKGCYIVGEYIYQHGPKKSLELVVPEIKEISANWDTWNDHEKGSHIGYVIGKYGLDIFAPGLVIKGIKALKQLKRANTMLTLEQIATSASKEAAILEESAKRAALRAGAVSETLKKGKILVKSSNVAHHVMQPKHAWDKLVKLTGNVQEDFKKVIILLEENNVLDKKFIKETTSFPEESVIKNIIRADHEIKISGYKIQAVFETYIESGETFLKDAWVIIKS